MTLEDSSENYRRMALDALKRAEKAVSPNVRSRCLLMASQWNRRAFEMEQAESRAPADSAGAGTPQDAPPPRA